MPANPDTIQLLFFIVVPVAAGGAAFGGVRSALNGTRDTVRRIEAKVDRNHEDAQRRFDRVEGDVRDTRERVVRLEAHGE
ncbi:MAG: hypothetical protein AB7N73_15770 [Gemmatimonadales bacterium]